MNREQLHKLIDEWFDSQPVEGEKVPDTAKTIEVKVERKLPEGKRVVRTKASGDTVYYLDEVAKSRQRIVGTQVIPGPDIVESLGFTMADVEEVEDTELFKYRMGPPLYKANEST